MRINVVVIFIIGLLTLICAEKSDNEIKKNREKRTVGFILGSLIKGLILKDAILQFLVNATTPTASPPQTSRPPKQRPRPSKRPRPSQLPDIPQEIQSLPSSPPPPSPPPRPPKPPKPPKTSQPSKPAQPPRAQQPSQSPQKRPKPPPSQSKPTSPSKAPSTRPSKPRPPPPSKSPPPPSPPPPPAPTTKKPRKGKAMAANTNAKSLTPPPPPPPPPTNPPDSSDETDMISTEDPDFGNKDDQMSTTEIQGLNGNADDETTLDYDMGGQPNNNYISSSFYADEDDGPSKIGLNQFFPQNPSPAQSYVKTNAYEFTNYHGQDQIKFGSQQAEASALRHYFDPSYEIHNVNLDYDHYYYRK